GGGGKNHAKDLPKTANLGLLACRPVNCPVTRAPISLGRHPYSTSSFMHYLLLAQRALSSTERFVLLPFFVLLGLVLIGLGAKAIVEKRIGARRSERLLYG